MTLAEFTAWLESEFTAGRPVTVYFKLATPIVTDLTYKEVATYYTYTNIYTDAIVQPILEAKIRVIEK